MMEKVTSDDTTIPETNGIFNKLPSWLVEMTESVKKLKAPEEGIDFLPTRNVASDELEISSTIISTSSDITDRDNKRDDVPYGSPYTLQASDNVADCIILQPSTTTSLPNTPKGRYEFPRAFSALSVFSLPTGPNESEVMTFDRYLDKRNIEKSQDLHSGITNWDNMHLPCQSKSSSRHAWSHTMLQEQPIKEPVTNQSSMGIHTKKSWISSRHQQQSTGKPSRIRIPQHKGTRLQSMEEDTSPNLPLGIIKRKQDYLAGVASREDIAVKSTELTWNEDKNNGQSQLRIETTGLGHASISMQNNVGDFQITDKVAQLNLQTSRKPNVTKIIEKSVQSDLHQTASSPKPLLPHSMRPVYHYDRYSPKDENVYQDFIIPELPRGSKLTIDILTTWGDKHYVGLNGIEIFSDVGESVAIKKIWADPTDINVLPEYGDDPRVVSNLINGINQTTDDYNLWLAPYTSGNHHYIHMTFESIVNIAMIRIWNYNKSRVHSYRGVRDVRITLDNIVIFAGEIARACGDVVGNINSFGDTILFTTDECILELISKHDATYSLATCNTGSPKKETYWPITTDTSVSMNFTATRFHTYGMSISF